MADLNNWAKEGPERKQTARQKALAEWVQRQQEQLEGQEALFKDKAKSGILSNQIQDLSPLQQEANELRAERDRINALKAEWQSFMSKDLPEPIQQPQQEPFLDKSNKEIGLDKAAQWRVENMPQHPNADLVDDKGAFIYKGDIPSSIAGKTIPEEPKDSTELVEAPKEIKLTPPKKTREKKPIDLKTEVDEQPPTALNITEDGLVEHMGKWVPLTQDVFNEKEGMLRDTFDSLSEQLNSSSLSPIEQIGLQKQLHAINAEHDALKAALEKIAPQEKDSKSGWSGNPQSLLTVDPKTGFEALYKKAGADMGEPDANLKLAAWLKKKKIEAIDYGNGPVLLKDILGE